jgi:tetratricopeptide (TPR) repeat protein
MGLKEKFQANMAGNRAYRAHAHANRLNDTGKPEQAETLYLDAMRGYLEAEKRGCDSPRIMTGFSVLLMREGQYEKARDLLLKLHQSPALTADDKFHLRINHAICQWRLQNLEKAIESMRQALSFAKTSLCYNVFCALLNEKARETGDFEEAEALTKEALTYDEDDAATLANAGFLALWQHEKTDDAACLEKAKALFSKGVKRRPNHPAALTGLALAEHFAGEKEAAKEHIDRALSLRFPPSSPVDRSFAEEVARKIG